MKALTICQPYAHLIVTGAKLVENREWPTRYRGPLAIHAGKSLQWLLGQAPTQDMAFGAVVGVAQLVDVLHIDRIRRGEYDTKFPWLREHTHATGTWCWVLTEVRRYAAPLPWKGAQGLWTLPDSAATENYDE